MTVSPALSEPGCALAHVFTFSRLEYWVTFRDSPCSEGTSSHEER